MHNPYKWNRMFEQYLEVIHPRVVSKQYSQFIQWWDSCCVHTIQGKVVNENIVDVHKVEEGV